MSLKISNGKIVREEQTEAKQTGDRNVKKATRNNTKKRAVEEPDAVSESESDETVYESDDDKQDPKNE